MLNHSFIRGAYRFAGGSQQLADALCDVIRRNGQMLDAGVVTALVAQRPEAQGYRGVMALCEWLVEGRRPEAPVNHMPIDILLKENIQYYKDTLI